jgi:hypothetical protein
VRGGSNRRAVSCTSVLDGPTTTAWDVVATGSVSERERRAKDVQCWTTRAAEVARDGRRVG